MFEQRDLAVQTSLIVLTTAQSCPTFPFLSQIGENESSFQETNLVAKESLTNARQEPVPLLRKSLPRSLYLSPNFF